MKNTLEKILTNPITKGAMVSGLVYTAGAIIFTAYNYHHFESKIDAFAHLYNEPNPLLIVLSLELEHGVLILAIKDIINIEIKKMKFI